LGERPQRLPADELGDEVARPGRRPGEVVDVEDERMVQPRDRVGLAIEPLADVLARVQVGVEHLDRHRPAKLRVPTTPDHGHAALADLLVEAVSPQLHAVPPRDAGVAAPSPVPRCSLLESATILAGSSVPVPGLRLSVATPARAPAATAAASLDPSAAQRSARTTHPPPSPTAAEFWARPWQAK